MKLYDYQIKYLDKLPKNVIMAADVGLGKTIMALEHAWRNDVEKIVVIAPASKVRTGDWQREIERFYDGEMVNVLTNYTVDDPQPLGFAHKSVESAEVISYEMFTKKWKDLVDEDTTLIIDESHFVCNATAKRSKAVIAACRIAKQWIMLSATPLPNGWRSGESYAVLTGLVRNKTEYVKRFERFDRSKGFPIFLGYNDTPLLDKWWGTIAKPLVRTGALVLPSASIAVKPAMQPKLAAIYKTAVKERIYGEELLDNPSKVFTTLRQIPNPARVNALQSIVEGTDEHVVVFYNFNSEREAVLEMLAKSFKGRKIYEQSGHQSKLPKRDNWKILKPSITLVQYQSGSQAIELTYASVTVYLSPPTSFSNYEQSKGRTRRNGQDKTTLFYHIAVEGSIDRHIWSIIKEKRDFSTAMFAKLLDTI